MRFLLMIAMVLMAGAAHAQEQWHEYAIDLAEDRVDITTGFDGTNIVVYGITNTSGAIAVTLKGPERTMVVRRKGKALGAWINAQSVEFHRVPGFYDYAVTRLANSEARVMERVDIGALDFYHEENLSEDDERRFRDALIRNKQAQGLFPLQPRDIEFLTDYFFKVTFHLPANVPSGRYIVDAMFFDKNDAAAGATDVLQVGQVGFSARVYLFAHEHGLLYGLMAILLAVTAGWGAFTFLRRD